MLLNYIYDTPSLELNRLQVTEKPVAPFWGTRVVIVYYGITHVLATPIKPFFYLIMTVGHAILLVQEIGSSESRAFHGEKVFNYGASILVSPVVEIILLAKAIFGFFDPQFYFQTVHGEEVTRLCDFSTKWAFNCYLIQLNVLPLWKSSESNYQPVIHAQLKKIGLLFQDEKITLSDQRKITIFKDILKSTDLCKPRWFEELYAIWRSIYEPEGCVDRINFYVETLVDGILYDFMKNEEHFNDVNSYRKVLGNTLQLSSHSFAQLDPSCVDIPKKQVIEKFLQFFTRKALVEYIEIQVNADHNAALRQSLLQVLAEKSALDPVAAAKKYTYEKISLNGSFKDILLTTEAIVVLLQDWFLRIETLEKEKGHE